ncbi:MAG TPA: helix-turn-helix domain-containing protein [Candidatus Paceibacterota bacterium]|jgi:excisionase family DNA binding protein|nr:helix-turn-helix domain-containing protein [Candidatus Paceibacterota bacterium]HPH12081.1 helix-turn-helix domain-containing protein [Thermotogota bacterium]
MELYTKKEMCEKLKISLAMLNRGLAAGALNFTKIGRRVLFSEEELARVAKEGFTVPKRRGNDEHQTKD